MFLHPEKGFLFIDAAELNKNGFLIAPFTSTPSLGTINHTSDAALT